MDRRDVLCPGDHVIVLIIYRAGTNNKTVNALSA